MIAPVLPQQRLPELISRLGALLEEIDDATGGQVDALVDPAGQVSWLLRGAQEALVRQEQEFRALAENSADLILRVSPGLRVLYANPAALRTRGEPLETLRGTLLHELMGGEAGTAGVQAAIEEVVATGQPREGEFVFGAGASGRVLHARLNPELGMDGELASVLAVLRDTTAIHASTRELAAAHKRISGILESVTDAFFSLDAGWRFTYLNSRAEALMRRERAELLGRTLWEAFPAAAGTRFETEYRRVAAERVPTMFEEFYAPLNTWREVHAYPAEDGGVSVYFRDISERKARERETADLVERLATKRALLEAVLRQLPVGVVIAEAPSGRLLMGNEQVDRIFGHGYRPSASIGEYGEWVGHHPDGRRVHSEEWPLSRALRTGMPAGPDEYHVPRADGTRGTARLSASPVMDAQGAVIAGVVVIADVTEQRGALDALRASDERFRLVNLATNDIIYDWELAAGTLDWNAALGTLGYDLATVPRTADWWYEQVHPDDTPRVRASLDRFLAGRGLYWSEDYRFRRADGSYARVYDRAHLVRGEDGRPERMIGSMLDVSQRDAADAALHHQALLLDTVEQAVIATDLQGNITYWNRFAEELYGWKRHEVMGRSVVEVTPSEEMMQEAAKIMERLSRGESWSGQFPVRRRDGTTFMAQVTDTPICGPTGELVGVVGVSFDITERRDLEEQLRQSQKMDAVGQLAGGVAHDFNNLLTVIQGTVELLKADLPPADPVRDDIHQIGEAAERAATLTRQLLAFSRRQILKPQPVNLASLVSGLLPMLKRLIGEDVELRFQAGAAAAQAEADPGQLEQVLLNLVVNARDAIPAGGGRIMVETREVEVRAGDEGPDAGLAPGRYAVLAVRDSGTGMPEEVRRRVFEPFFTTKEPGKGTGLGLSTVYGIARQSDGHVFVDSAPGKGTEFRVYLPARATPEPAGAEPRSPSPTGTETVLLIEDEEAVRSLTRRVLTRHGYTVLEARDGSEALEMARLQADRIDLVISDVVMPGRSGPAAAGEISHIAGGAPVLYMSGYTDDDILRRGIRTADTHFLQKPFSPHAILAQVRSLLDARRH
ncbi:MAG TPA: PAS domain S-box protein [Longimicrobium sp.]|jgi:PAS domain S-box-containing protein|uniref:hybrid sensor histidine kinase/response regulator n=1 Tax=Longimicrobium sp. TaxID=2029185 RepID=UPI002EDAC08D